MKLVGKKIRKASVIEVFDSNGSTFVRRTETAKNIPAKVFEWFSALTPDFFMKFNRIPKADPAIEVNALQAYREALAVYRAASNRYHSKRAEYDDGVISWEAYEPEIGRFREAEKAFDAIPFPDSLTTPL